MLLEKLINVSAVIPNFLERFFEDGQYGFYNDLDLSNLVMQELPLNITVILEAKDLSGNGLDTVDVNLLYHRESEINGRVFPYINIIANNSFFKWSLPADTYHFFFAGNGGCFFMVVDHEGGDISFSSKMVQDYAGDSYIYPLTSNPVYFPDAVPDPATNSSFKFVMLPLIRKELFTYGEKKLLVEYAITRGCPHTWVYGDELVENNSDFVNTEGWADITGWNDISAIDGKLRVTRGENGNFMSVGYQLPHVNDQEVYNVKMTFSRGTISGNSPLVLFLAPPPGYGHPASQLLQTTDGYVEFEMDVTAFSTGGSCSVGLRIQDSGAPPNVGEYFEIISVSVKKVVPSQTPSDFQISM